MFSAQVRGPEIICWGGLVVGVVEATFVVGCLAGSIPEWWRARLPYADGQFGGRVEEDRLQVAGALLDDLDAVGRGVQVANALEEPFEAGVQGEVHGALKGDPVGVGELVAGTAVVGWSGEFPGQIIGCQQREVV